MSKYYKAEDVIRKRAEDLADTSYWEYGNPKKVDEWIEVAEREFEGLPTIEVSEDAISREYILSFLDGEYMGDDDYIEGMNDEQRKIREVIRTAPSVIPTAKEGEWIPCSERLPSERGDYLVTFPLCDGEPCVYMLSFNKGKFYETDDEWGDVQYVDVTAWMPLPEPWKGASDE